LMIEGEPQRRLLFARSDHGDRRFA